MTVISTKCFLGYDSVEFLGHKVGIGRITPQAKAIQKIMEAPRPYNKRQLRFLGGLVGWYQKCIPNYASLTGPIIN